MKEHYDALCVEVLRFEPADVIMTSNDNPTETPHVPANQTNSGFSFF